MNELDMFNNFFVWHMVEETEHAPVCNNKLQKQSTFAWKVFGFFFLTSKVKLKVVFFIQLLTDIGGGGGEFSYGERQKIFKGEIGKRLASRLLILL